MYSLRIAYVGCGGVAAHYLDVYRKSDWAQVVVCIDSNTGAAEAAAASLSENSGGLTPKVTDDYSAALGDDVDLVVINTPNHLHHAQAISAFEAGKGVLLQKPVAPAVKEAAEIAEAARKAGTLSGLYMSYLDQHLMHDLKDMVSAGWFGEVGHFYARLMHRAGLAWSREAMEGKKSWRNSAAKTGGGCFIQLAVHYIHLMEWMLGSRVIRASAVAKNLYCPGIEGEDLASAILEFESGAIAVIDMAWSLYGEQYSIHGTEGSVEYLNNRFLIAESKSNSFRGRVVNYACEEKSSLKGRERLLEIIPPAMGDFNNPLNQHRLFLEAARDGREPFVSIESGVHDLRVVEAVYESARRGCVVELGREITFVP